MKNPRSTTRMPRRRFFRHSVTAAGALTLGANSRAGAVEKSSKAPYAYDISSFRQVDPKLIGYECLRRFKISMPDPRRLAVGSNGLLYLAAGNSLVVLTETATLVRETSFGTSVRSVAVADDATVYVGVKDHVEVLDPNGRRTASWDAAPGRALLTGLAAGPKALFAADAGNRTVWHYDRSGRLLGRIGDKDLQRNILGFVVPSPFFDLKVGKDQLLYVANPGRHRIEIYTLKGDLELAWGKPGAALEAFCGCCNPVAIELLADGRIITFEKGLPRVKVYSAGGELESVVAGPASFANPSERACEWTDCSFGGLDGAVDGKSRVYVLDRVVGEILVMARKKAELNRETEKPLDRKP